MRRECLKEFWRNKVTVCVWVCITVTMWNYFHLCFPVKTYWWQTQYKNIRILPVTSDLHLRYLIKPGTSNPQGTGPEVCSTKWPFGFWIFSFKKIETWQKTVSQNSQNQLVSLPPHDRMSTLECSYKKMSWLICIQLCDLAAIHFKH